MAKQVELQFEPALGHYLSGKAEGERVSHGMEDFDQRMETVFEFFPLYELRQKHSLTEYHGLELALALLLFIMEKMLRHSPCTYEDCERFVSGLLPLLLRRKVFQEEAIQVAQKLLEELTNRGSPFTYRFHNPLTGEERRVKFRLLEQKPMSLGGQDTVALRLTEKGLDLLFKSREIYRDLHFSVMQLYLDQQIRRGIFQGALNTVKELGVAVENIEEQCRRQRESVRRNVLESLNSPEYGRLLVRMEEQLSREQEIFESLKGLIRETKHRVEGESTGYGRHRFRQVLELSAALNRVAARHLELIKSRIDLENLVGQVLKDSIYQSLMVRFHMKREFLEAVLKNNPPGDVLCRTALWPHLRPHRSRLIGPETFLAPQRLLGRERERPLENETAELDEEAWAAWQKAEEERKERVVSMLQRFFGAILEVLLEKRSVDTHRLVGYLEPSCERSEMVALAHLLMLLHQTRRIRAKLPWDYVPGDEDLVEYAFYRLMQERTELANIGWIQVEAGDGVVEFPYGIKISNIVMKRVEENAVQQEDGGDIPGTVQGVAGEARG